MSNAIAARLFGDDYQGMVFWKYVNEMLHQESEIEVILYEDNDIKSFDDLVIHYKKAQKFRTSSITDDYYQIKFHMRQTDCFTIDNLLDPNFINAKEKSLMDNIVSAYKQMGGEFKKKRFIIYSMWEIKQDDDLYNIVSNVTNSFDIDKIFDSTTYRSKTGKIRKKFCEKLRITEEELKDVMAQTCIYSGREDIVKLKEIINRELQYNGLKMWPESKVTNPYVNMVRSWTQRGIKRFDKEFILRECNNEDLIIKEMKRGVIAIRSYVQYTNNLSNEVESMLDLVPYFEGRFLENDCTWDVIYKHIENYVYDKLKSNVEYQIKLPTHFSVAFLAGRIMNTKSGIKTIPIQRTFSGEEAWDFTNANDSSYDELEVTKNIINESFCDTAIVISITQNIGSEVNNYIYENGILIGTIYLCELSGTGNKSIKDGKHAWKIAEQLNNIIVSSKNRQKRAVLHIFFAGPISIMFNLGKLSLAYGKIQMYEYDFLGIREKSYYPTCMLPMEGEV